jgi:hypothetical protein
MILNSLDKKWFSDNVPKDKGLLLLEFLKQINTLPVRNNSAETKLAALLAAGRIRRSARRPSA